MQNTQQPTTPTQSFGFNDPFNDPLNPTQSSTPQTNTSTAPVQPTQPKDSGNFWSTVGGIALPVLGTLLAPETGGASLLASAALTGLGGVVGKAADNAVAGQNPFQTNDLTAGLLNAGGDLVGGALMKGAGAIANKVIAPAADKVAASLVAGQGKGALDNATAQYLSKNGVYDLKQMAQIAPIVTRENGAFSNAVSNSFANAADKGAAMDLSSLASQGKNLPGAAIVDAARKAGIAGDSNALKSIQEYVQGQLEKYNAGAITQIHVNGGGTISNFDNGVLNAQHPLNVFNMTQDMDRTASQWLKTPNMQAQGNALRNLSNNIKDQLYGEGTSIGQTGITDQVRQQALAELEPLKAINPQYYQTKVNELAGANTLGNLRTIQRPDVLASQALDTANHLANTSGGATLPDLFKVGMPVAGFGLGGPAGAVAGLAASKIAGAEGTSVAGAKVAAKLSDIIGSPTAKKVMNTLGRISGVTAANVPGMGAQPVQSPSILSSLPGSTGEQGMNQQPNQLNQLLQAMQAEAILAPDLNPGATSLLSSYAPQLQKNAMLKNAIRALPSNFDNAGGAQGVSVGGVRSVLSSFMPGTAANAYQGDVNSIAAQLASALGISTEAAQNLLPGLLQNEATAGQRQSVLGSMVNNLPS
jgi:hypothetical protein